MLPPSHPGPPLEPAFNGVVWAPRGAPGSYSGLWSLNSDWLLPVPDLIIMEVSPPWGDQSRYHQLYLSWSGKVWAKSFCFVLFCFEPRKL